MTYVEGKCSYTLYLQTRGGGGGDSMSVECGVVCGQEPPCRIPESAVRAPHGVVLGVVLVRGAAARRAEPVRKGPTLVNFSAEPEPLILIKTL